MALSFPLTQAEFFDGMKITSVSFRPQHPQQISQLGDGTILKGSLGASLWTGKITLASAVHADSVEMEAMLALLDYPGASFLAHDPRSNGPKLDNLGTILGASTPVISTLDTNNCELAIKGLPAGYQLSKGDLIGFQYGSSPVRFALHRLVESATASGAGVTPSFEVIPRIRPGALVDTPVTLKKPPCKAVLLPNPSYGSGRSVITAGASFNFIQTLR